jgi:hypothetical protein
VTTQLTRCLTALAAFGGSLSLAPSAFAFSDPASFALTPLAAGGGGLYFTGSPADGYTCKVCHSGGPEPSLLLRGLPMAGYQPRSRYEVVVEWPADVDKLALALELTDPLGKPAGSVELPPDAEIEPSEYCEPANEKVFAATITELADHRQVINLPDCGTKRLRFLWSAPASDVGPVWFAGSAVWSDAMGDTQHDGVTDFGRVLASPSSPALASMTASGCSVIAPTARTRAPRWSVFGWFGSLCLLRFTRRRSPP